MKTGIKVENLKKYFPIQKSFLENLLSRKIEYVKAVDGISFDIKPKEIFGLVGESGSGKTTTGRLVIRLIEPTDGKVFFDGTNIFELDSEELRRFRRKMQIVFQDATASLNPRMRIGDAIKHPLEIHKIGENDEERKELVFEALEKVGLSPPEVFYSKYPHQLSGGQRQRACFARAMVLNPDFIVADEPIAMIDVSLRAQIMDLMIKLKEQNNVTFLYITHDLATAKYICNRIAIMYLGKIVEIGEKNEFYNNPQHPYTVALLSSVPVPNPKYRPKRIIPKGEIPSPINPPPGCRFHPRCPIATKKCSKEEPKLRKVNANHYVACHHAGEITLPQY